MGLIRLLVIDNDADNISVPELIGQPLRKGRDIDRDGDLGSVEGGQHIIRAVAFLRKKVGNHNLPGVKVGRGVLADNIFFVFHRSVRQVQGSHLDKLHIVLGNQVSSLHILFYLYHFHFSVREAVDKRRNPECDTESEDNTDNSYHRSVAGDSHFTFHK